MYHSIIVGFGLAGLCYALQLQKRNKTFLIINHPSIKGASLISSGLCNPFNFKRYTLAWRATDFFSYAKEFFLSHEQQIGMSILRQMPIYKQLDSIGEWNLWQSKCDQPFFHSFFEDQILKNECSYQSRGSEYGVVRCTFQIDLELVFDHFLQSLEEKTYVKEIFDSDELHTDEIKVTYKQWTSQHIVFCQGYGLKSNPLTHRFPLVGNKGEILMITSDAIPNNQILKSKVYVIPLVSKNHFWVGATFDRESKSMQPTSTSRQKLMDDLNQSMDVDFHIVSHQAQIRPTMIDRRPLLGKIPNQSRAFVFNGLGTRGIMMAPLLSQWLYQHIEGNVALPQEIATNRFHSMEKESNASSRCCPC
ncbi:MAG: FAD-dependent oxidoreductase [Flavobacteriaceae bacterium]|nr:FAD-dependent oxidoreductase [Flavobacteriaceae bacterium]MCY4267408.1 FAD-dependent oxidoreductase [Flavobacteriaceae bacterium]